MKSIAVFFREIFRWVMFPAGAALVLVGSPAMGSIVPHGGGFLMSLDDCNDCAVLAHHELAGEQFCHDRGGEYWAMSFDGENTLPPPKSLVFYCDSPRSAQEPIDVCFSKVADHVTANGLAVEVPSLQSRVFPSAGNPSVQALRDARIPALKVRQLVEALSPVYERCVQDSYERTALKLEETQESHLAARVELMQLVAEGGISYAEYARHLQILRGQLSAGVFFWGL